MRQPTFSRRKTRQQRLMRTGIGVVVLVGLIAVIGNLLGGEPGPKKTDPDVVPTVSFVTTAKGYSNAGKPLRPAGVKRSEIAGDVDEITTMLNGWYQRGWVDVANFGDGTFLEIGALFAKDAQVNFKQDLGSLTIGDGRTDVKRVEPSGAEAAIAVYLEDGSKPTFAVVDVDFAAVAEPKRKGARPIDIAQSAQLHLEKTDDGWRVVYYEAQQTQEEREPPTPSPTVSPS